MRFPRRHFLAAAALALASSRVRAAGRSELRLGLSAGRWGRALALDELLDLLEAARIDGVELASGGAQQLSIELGPESRELLRRRIEERAVTLVGLACDVRLGAPDAGAERAACARARAWLELSHELGASGLRLAVAAQGEATREAWLTRGIDSLRPLAARAAELELELRVAAPGAPGPWRALLDAVDRPALVAAPTLDARVPAELAARLGRSVRVRELPDGEGALGQTVARLAREESASWLLLDPERDAAPDLTAALEEQRTRFEQLVG